MKVKKDIKLWSIIVLQWDDFVFYYHADCNTNLDICWYEEFLKYRRYFKQYFSALEENSGTILFKQNLFKWLGKNW